MTEQLSLFFESWDFFKNAVFASTIAGVLLGFSGVYILLKRMVFLSAAVSQISGAGIALAYLAGIHLHAATGIDCHCAGDGGCHCHGMNEGFLRDLLSFVMDPIFFAIVAALVTIYVLSLIQKGRGGDNSSVIAFVYLTGASATLLIGTRILSEVQDIQQLLFGNAVLVSTGDLEVMVIMSGVLMVVHLYLFRGFCASAFFRERSQVAGLPAGVLDFVLLSMLAVALAVSTRILGALPVFALSVLPAMSVRLFCRSLKGMFIFSALSGGIFGFAGYVAAFVFHFPVGASQAGVCLATFVFFWIFRYIFRLFAGFRNKECNV